MINLMIRKLHRTNNNNNNNVRRYLRKLHSSPVPELSLLRALHRGEPLAREERVQDNLHEHAQKSAIFSCYPGLSHRAPRFSPYVGRAEGKGSGTVLIMLRQQKKRLCLL